MEGIGVRTEGSRIVLKRGKNRRVSRISTKSTLCKCDRSMKNVRKNFVLYHIFYLYILVIIRIKCY